MQQALGELTARQQRQRHEQDPLGRRRGHALVTGTKALEALRRGSYDALIVDLKLPDMRGRALFEQVKADLGIDAPDIALTDPNNDGVVDAHEEAALSKLARAVIVKGQGAPAHKKNP